MTEQFPLGDTQSIEFRAWTGKQMIYQDKNIEQDKELPHKQYLASFIRRVVLQISLERGRAEQHESYLPARIDEYLMLSTGLPDKNGKKIFRLDILRDRENILWKVQWNNEKAQFELAWCGGPQPEYYRMGMYLIKDCQCEIIGNVKENPELLASAKGEEAPTHD